ncbi:heavy metal translocating P-type ATPase [Spirulina sp. CS-785/01]|uniref:heavy metal translocating P-type ATPase n=1 Tax=Spirulina sp. CS-785/01 TaxID=3021716 RepID=UPI00232C8A88|nr:heavy metal translocating P-type ATPase [Spirulina sp. CS-785/01]MDB9313710.1 heavy metal translocating P-type ATPase [Spirulina sp. CS-785/01]
MISLTPTPPASPQHSGADYHIVHRLPGRIRLRIPLLGDFPHHAATLREILEQTAGVTHVRINAAARSVIIGYAPDRVTEQALAGQIQAYLPQLGQPSPEPMSKPQTAKQTGIAAPPAKMITQLPTLTQTAWSNLQLPGLAALLALLSRVSRLGMLRPVAGVAFLAAAFPVAQRAFESLVQQRKLNIDCLDFLALSLSALQGKLVTPAMVIVLHELGDAIREQTARVTEVRTANLQDAIGRFAWVQREIGQPPQKIPSESVQVGDTVIVYPGEQIPVDGTVLHGEAIIDQQSLTGEAMPVVRREADRVLASTLLRSGQIHIKAEQVGTETRAAASIALLQKAPVHDTRMANYAEKVADRLILPALLLSALVLGVSRNPARAASILTLDFVTGIRVSLPTAFLGALNHTTQHGLLVRSGRTLEQLAEVDTVVFDKTGTLTQGSIAVTRVKPVGGMAEAELLGLAAAAEQRLNHPVAQAIVEYAHQQGNPLPKREDWFYEVGLGVQATIAGREVWVGSERFLQQVGIDWGEGHESAESRLAAEYGEEELQSRIYVACDGIASPEGKGVFCGVIEYTDPLRPDSAALINTLQEEYGLKVYLLTGDHPQRAAQVAKSLKIPTAQVYAEAFPDEKARIVRNLHSAGRTVAFVGDGLNDSVALAYADVSVSFAQGSDIARETADVVLMNNQLDGLLEAVSIARQTQALIEQNIALVVAPNLVALGLATTMGLNPLIATAIHNGSAIAAGVNSLRPLVQHQLELDQPQS